MEGTGEARTDESQRPEPGDEIIALRVVSNTRKQYETTLARLVRWLETEHPASVDSGRLALPLSVSVCKSLLNFSSVKRSRHGVENVPRQYNSYATISGVQSAIKYEYTERGMALGSEIETLIAEFSAGYKRKVAQLRSSGELRIMEGKAPMSVAG
ncbi:hypothetical protein AaE_007180 [Aphanomyces astaci]|uniref:Uncharacterized protein n=1 Tax=Aphanomyces astaci TaxID=112090 RepID=A0A6A5AI60_APHAT|nr:hypothetical protein AaE_007180 [Aphanomyces astaci]